VQDPVRVLVVDDSAFMRRAVERMLVDSPAIRVVGTAANGEEAVSLACELHPDIIVMDVNMPEMDGLQALEHIMSRCPTPVLMLSTLTRAGAATTLRALELGAVDFVDKSLPGTAMDIYQLGPKLRDKVLAVASTELQPAPPRNGIRADATPPRSTSVSTTPAPPLAGMVELIAIGASTGGPRALTEILPLLPANLGAAVVVAQHMPAGFTTTLAERLNERCALEVREAADGDRLRPGMVLIAPGGKQTRVVRAADGFVARVTDSAPDLLHHPSVDVLLGSVATAVGRRAIGVVLTGMGYDGAQGMMAMREAGARTLVESNETAVINGMPNAARPYAERTVPLDRIAATLVEMCAPRPDHDARVG
jgi:two-component system, chemotaxis family, protein-glutamate methylesterase/glutaminase